MRKLICLALAVFMLIVPLAGCGGTNKETTKPVKTTKNSSSPTGPGTYLASFNGVEISLLIPAVEDSTTQAVRDFAAKVEGAQPASPITFGSFTVKNNSSKPTTCDFYSFSLTFNDGKQVDSQRIAVEYVGNLHNKIPPEDESGLYNEGVNLYNQLLEHTEIMPGTSRASYCVFPIENLTGLKKVFVSSFFGDTKEMKKQ